MIPKAEQQRRIWMYVSNLRRNGVPFGPKKHGEISVETYIDGMNGFEINKEAYYQEKRTRCQDVRWVTLGELIPEEYWPTESTFLRIVSNYHSFIHALAVCTAKGMDLKKLREKEIELYGEAFYPSHDMTQRAQNILSLLEEKLTRRTMTEAEYNRWMELVKYAFDIHQTNTDKDTSGVANLVRNLSGGP